MLLKMRAVWDTVPCSFAGVDRRFIGAYRLHHLRPDDTGSTHLWNVGLPQDYTELYPRRLEAVRSWNLTANLLFAAKEHDMSAMRSHQ
jgi:hypothetical protein